MNEPTSGQVAAHEMSELELSASIRASTNSAAPVYTRLRTNERVIARVTDGIYRQPGSAIRELISNAYDADASRVVIKTDAPRFETISIEDDGHGMSPEAVAYLLMNIGGSAKRRTEGAALGMTSTEDPLFSPGGRRLIGKIGIGLFSVSQLTHSFQIVTKTKGDSFRTVASVVLRQYSEEDGASSLDEDGNYETGKVAIWREPAVDSEVCGTTIVLNSIRRQARETLRSQEWWAAVEEAENNSQGERTSVEPPKFHIGRVDASGDVFQPFGGRETSVPWSEDDEPSKAFQKLVDCIWTEAAHGNPNPRLERLFDYYLRMIWQLALAVPLPYCEGHLFDKESVGWVHSYLLGNSKSEGSIPIGEAGKLIREAAALETGKDVSKPFHVFIDNLELSRPIRYGGIPATGAALQTPIAFLGKCEERFEKISPELSGGLLQFEAYLFWAPKIAPVEHQGSLIRIHGSSGTLFDPTFMRYQVQEIRRLKQITCEIFVSHGLDGALNIDRESFNSAHPHAVFITKWLHNALRQVANVQKKLSSEILDSNRSQNLSKTLTRIDNIAEKAWRREVDDPAASPPPVHLLDENKQENILDGYAFKRANVVTVAAGAKTPKARSNESILENKIKAIAQVLASYGVFDTLPKMKQEELLQAIYEIMEASGE